MYVHMHEYGKRNVSKNVVIDQDGNDDKYEGNSNSSSSSSSSKGKRLDVNLSMKAVKQS